MNNFIDGFLVFARKVRVALTPPGVRIHTHLSEGVVVAGRNINGYGGRGIYIHRDSIEPEYSILDQFIAAGDVFVDVGANTGIYTLKAAYLVGDSGCVVSMEPFPDTLSDLAYNVRLNGRGNVRLRGLCAAGVTAPDMFWTNFDKPNSFSLLKRDKNAKPISVLKIKLDDLFVIESLDKCNYIKIDAEGAEREIIEGASSLIEKHRPIIQAEVNIVDFDPELPDYATFRAVDKDGSLSINKIYIPLESDKIKVAEALNMVRC